MKERPCDLQFLYASQLHVYVVYATIELYVLSLLDFEVENAASGLW